MGKKNFKIGALDQLTGAKNNSIKETVKPIIPSEIETKKEVEAKEETETSIPMERNTRSSVRKGKPVTLYLNIDNYKSLKTLAKKQGLPVSAIIDQFISEYIVR